MEDRERMMELRKRAGRVRIWRVRWRAWARTGRWLLTTLLC